MMQKINKEKRRAIAVLLVLCMLLSSVWFYFTYVQPMEHLEDGGLDLYYNSTWDSFSESLVLGRMYQMQLSMDEQNPQGFLCGYKPITNEEMHLRTRRAFLADGDISADNVFLWSSGIGAQGTLQGVLNMMMCAVGIPATGRYLLLRYLAALLFFSVLMLICLWIQTELGGASGAVVFVAMLLSHWTRVTMANLYWLPWTYLAPMVAAIALCRAMEQKGKASWWHYGLVGTFLLLKFSFGFEFASTLLVCMEIPIIYYMAKHWNERRRWVKAFLITGGIGLGAFAVSFLVLVAKISTRTGDFVSAIKGIIYTISVRTGAFAEDSTQAIVNNGWTGLEYNAFEVITRYMRYDQVLPGLSMGKITVIYFCVIAVLLLITLRFNRSNIREMLVRHAKLVVVVVASYFAPISWLVLARGHSMVHTHIVYLLWLFPTLLFVAAHTAVCVKDICVVLKSTPLEEELAHDL